VNPENMLESDVGMHEIVIEADDGEKSNVFKFKIEVVLELEEVQQNNTCGNSTSNETLDESCGNET
jgi:hypothetical protein